NLGFSSKEVKDHVCSGHRLPRPVLKVRNSFTPHEMSESKEQEEESTVGRCPLDLYTQMLQCWHLEPECRPTFAEMNVYLTNYYSRVIRT
ncbi:hypothetical protein FBUS_01830, partial [Fasciolopsis buskii]